jgi:predicted LPLAT superfamily acyltransferase
MGTERDPRRRTAASAAAPDWTVAHERGSMMLLRVMTCLSLQLGRPVARIVLYGIAAYFFVFAPRAGQQMRAYLRRALRREPTAADRYRLLLSFASTIHDRLYLMRERYELFDILLEGEQTVAERFYRGEGAFLIGAHVGSFEVIRAIGRRQPGLTVAMAMYEDNARKINAMLAAVNPGLRLEIIPLGKMDSMLQIRARLDAGAFVGLLGDRTFGPERYEPVEFLGATAWFPTSAMRAAAMLQRSVIFMAGLYRGGNRYHVIFEELADFTAVTSGQREQAVRTAIERFAAVLERLCRTDPYNWFNFFDFWRQPESSSPGARP